MLRTAIVERMLANTPQDNRWMAVYRGIKEFVMEFVKIIIGKRPKTEDEKKIGDHFFDHPLIKNYGASRLYPLPSYISAKNFSTVMFEVLKQDFTNKIDHIAKYKSTFSENQTKDSIKNDLMHTMDIVKIKELIDYYTMHYDESDFKAESPKIDIETLKLLKLHLHESLYNVEIFTEKIEGWFEDTMNRAAGWYKRQTQIILFVIGIVLAILFNVDTLQITQRLSVDKETRDKLVEMAIETADKYKDDPRVKKTISNGVAILDPNDTTGYNDSIYQKYQNQVDSIKKFLEGDLKKANDLIAIGWEDIVKKQDSSKIISQFIKKKDCSDPVIEAIKKDSLRQIAIRDSMYNMHRFSYTVSYIYNNASTINFLGFIITAFAICMGAPFWFDLLNKLVKLRAAGKKEDAEKRDAAIAANAQQPITIHVNPQPGEEAVG